MPGLKATRCFSHKTWGKVVDSPHKIHIQILRRQKEHRKELVRQRPLPAGKKMERVPKIQMVHWVKNSFWERGQMLYMYF